MTAQDLHDLLHDRVADVTTADLAPDLPATAWRGATRRRTRRRTTAVAGAAVAVLVVGAVVAGIEDGRDGGPDGAPASSVPTPSGGSDDAAAVPTATRMDDYRGAGVWEAPPAEDELDLPRWTGSPLPEVIDLTTATTRPAGVPARGLVAEGSRVFALGEDGSLSELDVSGLAPVSDEGGNRLSPVTPYSLSSDGTRAFFVQERSLEVLDLVTGRWQTVGTPDWLAEGARWASADEIWVPNELSSSGAGTLYGLDGSVSMANVHWVELGFGTVDDTWGAVASTRDRTAQTVFLPGPVDATGVSNPEAVVVRTGARFDALTMWPAGTATRQKGCCEVLGFLDDDTVLFASRSTEGYRLLAWRIGTADVYLVSRFAGPGTLVGWRPEA